MVRRSLTVAGVLRLIATSRFAAGGVSLALVVVLEVLVGMAADFGFSLESFESIVVEPSGFTGDSPFCSSAVEMLLSTTSISAGGVSMAESEAIRKMANVPKNRA